MFLLQGMGSDFELCAQLEKVSSFISHYQEHRDYNDSFYQYILEDYFSDLADTEQHYMDSHQEKNPQHNHHQCCYPVVFVTPSNSVLISSSTIKEATENSFYQSSWHSRFLESLFQPPQV